MVNSIRYFEEECINRFEKLEDDFMKSKTVSQSFANGAVMGDLTVFEFYLNILVR